MALDWSICIRRRLREEGVAGSRVRFDAGVVFWDDLATLRGGLASPHWRFSGYVVRKGARVFFAVSVRMFEILRILLRWPVGVE